MKVSVVIALGGFGSRLIDVTNDSIPKPMVLCGGRPFLSYLLDYLYCNLDELNNFVFLTGHLGETISNHYGGAYKGIPICYLREEKPLGTGGALRRACEELDLEDILYLNGDTLHEIDYARLFVAYEDWSREGVVISAFEMENAYRYGSISMLGSFVTEFHEKKRDAGKQLIFSGSAVLRSDHVNRPQFSGMSDFSKDFLSVVSKANELKAVVDQGYFVDIGIPEDYFSFCQHVSKHETV